MKASAAIGKESSGLDSDSLFSIGERNSNDDDLLLCLVFSTVVSIIFFFLSL